MKALFFDCDGVLADTERDGHRVAFNRAFADAGLDVTWGVARYGELLRVAGGKERMERFFEEAGWPVAEPERAALIRRLHAAKTEHFMRIVEAGELPARPGIGRVIDAAAAAGLRLAVCSTSHERAVTGVVLHSLGAHRREKFAGIFAGDVVAAKKPAPDIYLLAATTLGLEPTECLVIEDSANGLRAALAAGMACVVTTSGYTGAEDFSGAARVVPELGEPPGPHLTLADLLALGPVARHFFSAPMTTLSLPQIELVIRTMADTAIANEHYFSELDGACGDGDFGTSLATGFRKLLEQWDGLDRSSIAAFLLKVSMVITSNVGGCSGPIWGTGFMRAAGVARGKETLALADIVAMARAAMAGMMARGGASLGDKTLLDALAPATEKLAAAAARPEADVLAAWDEATAAAVAAIEGTRHLTARRGRQSFTGDRSQGTLDPGIVGVATMMQAVGRALRG